MSDMQKQAGEARDAADEQLKMAGDPHYGAIRKMLTAAAIKVAERKGLDTPGINELYTAAIGIIASAAVPAVPVPPDPTNEEIDEAVALMQDDFRARDLAELLSTVRQLRSEVLQLRAALESPSTFTFIGEDGHPVTIWKTDAERRYGDHIRQIMALEAKSKSAPEVEAEVARDANLVLLSSLDCEQQNHTVTAALLIECCLALGHADAPPLTINGIVNPKIVGFARAALAAKAAPGGDEREAFWRWAIQWHSEWFNAHGHLNVIHEPDADRAWEAWQARAALSTPAPTARRDLLEEMAEKLEELMDAVPKQTSDADWWPDGLTYAMKEARTLLSRYDASQPGNRDGGEIDQEANSTQGE